ncbi:MAG: hypothetical protein WD894_23895 [Pirellulales bacterium]
MASDSDIDWLTSPAAAPWLEMAIHETGGPLALATRLRKDLSPARARLVVEQANLRQRAAEKFSFPGRMFFTPRALEQATDDVVARYKAARFPKAKPVADLCCGIGGDLIALARRGPVTGVERDGVVARVAEANLRTATAGLALSWKDGRDEANRVAIADVASFSLAGFAAWHLDPDRRPAGRRTTRVELHEPGPEVIARLLGDCPNAALKLAPAAVLNDSCFDNSHDSRFRIPWHEAELEWISRKRQCRQLVAWFGSLRKTPRQHRATLLASDLSTSDEGLVPASFVGLPGTAPRVAPQIGRYVLEPDPAVLAADLTGALAASHGLQAVAADVAYLTADKPHISRLLAAFEVLEVMPYQPKALKSWLRSRCIGRLEVKKRGVEFDPQRVQAALQVSGDNEATLLLCRIRGKTTAILARRV